MAKETILKEKGTGEVMYPWTMAALVGTAGGGDVERALAELPLKVFVDMWLERGLIYSGTLTDEATLSKHRWSQYDPVGHPDEPFGLDRMWLSYSEAVTVMAVPDTICYNEAPNQNYQYSRARTFFPIKGTIQSHRGALFMQVPNLEVVRLVNYYITNNGADPDTYPQLVTHTRNMFFLCPRLREVKGVIKLLSTDDLNAHFYDTWGPVLETLWVQGICLPVHLHRCPKLRLECIAYMVEYAANTKEIEIMLHPDVFALLPDELIAKAAEKEISFVARA